MNLKLSAAGFAIQTAKGTAKTQPAFWGPLGGGALVTLPIDQKEDELTSAKVAGVGEFRESVAVAVDCETRAWPKSIGGRLYAVLGDISTVGGAAPYTHTIIPAALLPWATVFGAKDAARKAASDCKLDELKIEWEGNGPLKVTETWAGLGFLYSADAYSPVLDETGLAYLKGIMLATTLDLNGATYDGGAKVLGGSIDIKRNIAGDVYSGTFLPGDIYEGALEIDVELKVRVPDLLPVRALLTGTASGTVPTPVVPYGSFSLVFTQVAATEVLTLGATRVAWTADEPDADPKGGPAEITLKGRCYGAATTPFTAFTAVVVNAHASYAG